MRERSWGGGGVVKSFSLNVIVSHKLPFEGDKDL